MNAQWDKYEFHPKIGPLLQAYRMSHRELEQLKRDLRTASNIDEIIEASEGHTELTRKIRFLVDGEQAVETERRRDFYWLVSLWGAIALLGGQIVWLFLNS